MMAPALTRRIGLSIAAIAFFTAMAGWVGDTEAAPCKKPKSSSQMRYYGGPKSPMWPGQQSISEACLCERARLVGRK
jgi:hypothetical protein